MTTTKTPTRGTIAPTPPGEVRLPAVSIVSIILMLCIPVTVALAVLALWFGGGFSTGTALYDPGPVVDVGLPVVRAIHDGMATVTVGLLVLAAIILPGQTKVRGEVSRSQWRAVRWAGWAGCAWFVAACIVIVLTGIQVSGVPIGDPLFWPTFMTFVFQIELGQSLAVSAACVLVATLIALFSRRLTAVGFAAGFAVFALLPLALSGHAAGSFDHANAVNSLAVHLVGVTVWVGGLVGLLLLRRTVGRGFGTAVARYSVLAGWAFAAVAFSGVINAAIRLGSVADILTPYGLLIVAKASILVVLGIGGALQRRRVIPRLKQDPTNRRLFVRLATGEAVFMAFAIGIAVGLAKSPPPVSQAPLTGSFAREGLLGFPYPPPVTPMRMITEWDWNWMWFALALVLAGCYVWAAWVLHKRGDHWPLYRTACWLAGCGLLIWATNGGPYVYDAVHFSTHMVLHMLLMTFIPILLVLSGPVLLALRALPTRHDGSRGVREWLLMFTHSRFLGFVSKPLVAGAIFAGSLFAFYYSPAFEASLTTHVWHVAMCVHFLLSGYLFFWVFIGIDPGPKRPSYPVLFIVLLATMAFHTFFGVALMLGKDLLAADWWHALGQTNTAALIADQQAGGGVAWATGEIPMAVVALTLAIMWARSDERTAVRLDRQADRDGDADLRAYNARLAAMNEGDTVGGESDRKYGNIRPPVPVDSNSQRKDHSP